MASLNFFVFINGLIMFVSATYIELNYDIHEGTAHWVANRPYFRNPFAKGFTKDGFWYENYEFNMGEHTGTHVDAPSHFAKNRWTVDEIPLDHLIAVQGVVVDIRDKVAKNPVYELSGNDLMNWLYKYGPLPHRAIVLINTGWSSRYGNKTAYFGTDTNNTNKLIYPGLSVGAAQILTMYEQNSGHKIIGVGIDTPSIDHGPSQIFLTHIELCRSNMIIIENVADMSKLPPTGFELFVMPMKLRGGSGAPARLIAKLNSTNRERKLKSHEDGEL